MILVTSANLRWSKRRSKARSASGGIVYGGEADGSTSEVLQRSASGGIVYDGSVNGVIESVFRSASGGIVYGGTANLTEFTVFRSASGGIVYGGTANLTEFTVFRSASGGITYGGTAVPRLGVVWREAEGGITYGGSANIVMDISSPTQIANCINWLDATDASTLYADTGKTTLAAIDGTVAAWADKSSFGHDFASATTFKPARKDGYLLFGSRASLLGDWRGSFANIDAVTIFAVVEAKTGTDPSNFFKNDFAEFELSGNASHAGGVGGRLSDPTVAATSTYDPAAKNLLWAKIDYTGSNTVKAQVNDGLVVESTAMTGSGSNALNGGVQTSTFVSTAFRHYELIAYNRALTIGEIEAVKTYLRAKHNF